MTVIAALRTADRVWMAGDTGSFDGFGTLWPNPHKVFATTMAGEAVVVGTSGRSALGAMIRYDLTIDTVPGPDDADAWAHAVAEAITEMAYHRKITRKDDSSSIDGTALFAWRDRLWAISDRLALPIEDFAAIGSGNEVALGAMEVTWHEGMSEDSAKWVVTRAAQAACRWEESCREPVVVCCTEPAP